jgi:GT2 family glycosyltransferase
VGFSSARGEIIAVTDDDVLVPQGWIRNIVQTFWRQDIWMVNGSVLPYELNSKAELDFEDKGGFPSSHVRIEGTGDYIRGRKSFSLFSLGVSANMAFRRDVIDNPAIGMMDEALGPGTPAGAGEDMEFIYRVLKEGHTVVFEPTIWVYHRHRRSIKELNRQIYNYGKSSSALYLNMFFKHSDYIAIPALIYHMPKYLIKLMVVSGGRYWKLSLLGLAGYIVGFPAYFWSRSKDKRYERKNVSFKRT